MFTTFPKNVDEKNIYNSSKLLLKNQNAWIFGGPVKWVVLDLREPWTTA
jgi:hypothetical protein